MSEKKSMSRRQFVAGASSYVVAGAALAANAKAVSSDGSNLAVNGGEKAVKQSVVATPRWGEPERKQIEAMLQQNSLFYWKGPQTELFLQDRYQGFCAPREHNANLPSQRCHILYQG